MAGHCPIDSFTVCGWHGDLIIKSIHRNYIPVCRPGGRAGREISAVAGGIITLLCTVCQHFGIRLCPVDLPDSLRDVIDEPVRERACRSVRVIHDQDEAFSTRRDVLP